MPKFKRHVTCRAIRPRALRRKCCGGKEWNGAHLPGRRREASLEGEKADANFCTLSRLAHWSSLPRASPVVQDANAR